MHYVLCVSPAGGGLGVEEIEAQRSKQEVIFPPPSLTWHLSRHAPD